jgi:NADH-quinone oxidoreductase subunit C
MQDLADYIAEMLEDYGVKTMFQQDQLAVTVDAQYIPKVLASLRDDKETSFHQLLDVTAVDYPQRAGSKEGRFEVVYHMLSLTHNHRVRVKAAVDEDVLVPSVVELFSSAGWFEREVWDMYGILFDGNPDLRRILTDYGFEGHPLRKDFPLTGYVEVRYDEEQKRVVYEPVQLQQDFRSFDNLSPWEGMTDVMLPGDEKGAKPDHGWKPTEKKGAA